MNPRVVATVEASRNRSTLATIAALVLAIAGPPALVVVSERAFGPTPDLAIQVLLQLVFCSFAGVVLFVVAAIERQPLASIGLQRPGWSTIAWGLALAFVVVFLLPPITNVLMAALNLGGFEAGVAKLTLIPIWFRIIVAITGGIVEEILYRGYAVERFTMLIGRRWLGAVLALLGFALAHIPAWGLGPAIGANIPFGAIMVLSYLWKRDLAANMIAHSIALLASLLALPT